MIRRGSTASSTRVEGSLTQDCCSGHSEPSSSIYHYHYPPSCLLAQIDNPYKADGHSPQIGWSYDGFPVYGPLGPGGVEIMNCGADGADDTRRPARNRQLWQLFLDKRREAAVLWQVFLDARRGGQGRLIYGCPLDL